MNMNQSTPFELIEKTSEDVTTTSPSEKLTKLATGFLETSKQIYEAKTQKKLAIVSQAV